MLEEGKFEEQLKSALEADLQIIGTTTAAEIKRKEHHNFDAESKDTSHSGSVPGSEPLSRKEFIFDGLKYSAASSMEGSKASLSSSLHKGSKASLSSTTPPKGSKSSLVTETAPKGSKSSLVTETPPKGSKSSLVTETVPKGSKSSLVSETPPKENKPSLVTETAPKETNASFVSETPPKGTTVNLEPETPPSSLVSEPSVPQKEESDSKEASADVQVSS